MAYENPVPKGQCLVLSKEYRAMYLNFSQQIAEGMEYLVSSICTSGAYWSLLVVILQSASNKVPIAIVWCQGGSYFTWSPLIKL